MRRTLASIFSIDRKHSGFVDRPVDEAWTVGTDVTTVHVVHKELQWTSCERRNIRRPAEFIDPSGAHLTIMQDILYISKAASCFVHFTSNQPAAEY